MGEMRQDAVREKVWCMARLQEATPSAAPWSCILPLAWKWELKQRFCFFVFFMPFSPLPTPLLPPCPGYLPFPPRAKICLSLASPFFVFFAVLLNFLLSCFSTISALTLVFSPTFLFVHLLTPCFRPFRLPVFYSKYSFTNPPFFLSLTAHLPLSLPISQPFYLSSASLAPFHCLIS